MINIHNSDRLVKFIRIVEEQRKQALGNSIPIRFNLLREQFSNEDVLELIEQVNSLYADYSVSTEEDFEELDNDFRLDGSGEKQQILLFRIDDKREYKKLISDLNILQHQDGHKNTFILSNGLKVDLDTYKISYADKSIDFSPKTKPFRLFIALLKSENKALSYQKAIELVYPENSDRYTVDDVRKVRQELNKFFREIGMSSEVYNSMIVTKSRYGYSLNVSISFSSS